MQKLDQACPIWGTEADVYDGEFDGWRVESPRAGGAYKITRSAIPGLARLDGRQRALVTTWLVDQRRAGEPLPMLSTYNVAHALSRKPMRFSEQRRRFFLFLTEEGFRAGHVIKTGGYVQREWSARLERLAAWIEAASNGEETAFVNLMSEAGYLSDIPNAQCARLTAKGFEELELVQLGGAATDQAFVAMWFDRSMDSAYIDGFEPGTRAAGYRALRIDRKEHANKIDDEIIAEIKRSRFVIADFTASAVLDEGRRTAVPRGGVYYEAGFAQGLGTPVIWTVREDCIGDVHFDTRQFAHIVWSTPADLAEKLTNRIRAVIGEGPSGPS